MLQGNYWQGAPSLSVVSTVSHGRVEARSCQVAVGYARTRPCLYDLEELRSPGMAALGLHDGGHPWPLRPELAASLGNWPTGQVALAAGDCRGWRLRVRVAVLRCCTGARRGDELRAGLPAGTVAGLGQIRLADWRLGQYRRHEGSECQPGGEDWQLKFSPAQAGNVGTERSDDRD